MEQCQDCQYESEVQSDRWGMKVETLCDSCREEILKRVQDRPMAGKKGNHVSG